MKNTFIKAYLVSLKKINVMLFTSIPRRNEMKFMLLEDGYYFDKLTLLKSNSTSNITLFEFSFTKDLQFGKHYAIKMSDFPSAMLDISNLVEFPEFDDLFNYDGDDLGAIYTKEESSFALWAPLASDVYLKLENGDGSFSNHLMIRSEKGVYRLTIKEDLLNRKYRYVVNNSGVINETNDPYGKGTSLNSLFSAVVDIKAIKNMGNIKPTNEIRQYVDSVIYEVGIRDFSEGNNNNIINKGKYLGFIEENRTTDKGNPCGLDYLKYLGVTHVQLNPIIDFRGVDDIDTQKSYNWGYDPITFFGIEGSYSLHPEIPMERLKEFKTLVNTLHKNNIRVIMDVVYNHIYNYETSIFEKVVPNYYFRRRRNMQIAEASGCGDDFASEKYMVRKIILDSIKYFVEVFDIDGYRFDLMGLLDVKTINKAVELVKSIKKDALMYGEGWNMGYELPMEEKACSENAIKMPNIAFFNDSFREFVKGPTFASNLTERGYIGGNLSYINSFEYALCGSVLPLGGISARFNNANQSINYIECHDNGTLFDKLMTSNSFEDEDMILRRVKMGNAITILAMGVPFIHMGQEIGLSKRGLDNTYNIPKVNNMDWSLVDERFEMVNYIKGLITMRKKAIGIRLFTPSEIDKHLSLNRLDNNLLLVSMKNVEMDDHRLYKEAIIIFNPTDKRVTLELPSYYNVLISRGGEVSDNAIHVKNTIVNPASLEVLVLNE